MTTHDTIVADATVTLLTKTDPRSPALLLAGRDIIAIKAGAIFAGHRFDVDTPVSMSPLEPGADYAVTVTDGNATVVRLSTKPVGADILGGFHFAPGGNASARAGGDAEPAVNPYSLWDLNFRPVCPDPRGMALVDKPGGRFWCDIYLCGAECHVDGTSRFGVTIADGDDCPVNLAGKRYKKFDYATAADVMAAHGKGLLGVEEFFAAAIGVTELTSATSDPERTGLDAPRTSRFGIMQATGNMWIWGHDGDPDTPRASVFGGGWFSVGNAGSRYADVAYSWPEDSSDVIGARGRSDHLQLG